MKQLKGSCLCGAVAFEVNDNFLYAGYCHCSRCRKASAAAGTAIGGLAKSDFTLTKGSESLTEYKRSEQSIAQFCKHCSSQLFGEKPETGLLHIRYGVLDDSPTLLPQAHMHVASKADWYQITDELPQFAEFPPAG